MAQAEESRVHTRLQKLALGVEESRAYWENVDPAIVVGPRALDAFEHRWFGAKSLARVRILMTDLGTRYDSFPEALSVLRLWARRGMDPSARSVLCHWHLQLADPLYRRFTSELLVRRRNMVKPGFDRDVVIRWVAQTYPDRWGGASLVQFASKLLSAASEASLVSPRRDPRSLQYPSVPDEALVYLLYLLRSVSFSGTLGQNPYLSSVGLEGSLLDQRLHPIPAITYRRLADDEAFDWKYPTLSAWAEATL